MWRIRVVKRIDYGILKLSMLRLPLSYVREGMSLLCTSNGDVWPQVSFGFRKIRSWVGTLSLLGSWLQVCGVWKGYMEGAVETKSPGRDEEEVKKLNLFKVDMSFFYLYTIIQETRQNVGVSTPGQRLETDFDTTPDLSCLYLSIRNGRSLNC